MLLLAISAAIAIAQGPPLRGVEWIGARAQQPLEGLGSVAQRRERRRLLTTRGFRARDNASRQDEGDVDLEATELDSPAAMLHTGPWRAWLASRGGELPFGLEIQRNGEAFSATIVNGEERIAVPETRIEGGEIVFDLPHYDSQVRAQIAPLGTRLEGQWKKRSGTQRWTQMNFTAEAGAAPRFRKGEALDSPALEGRFSVKFEKSEDPAVAVLRKGVDGGIEGTFLTSTGDFRWLAGSLEGSLLRLSCFDGAHAFLFRAFVGTGGTLRGDFWSGDSWHETWTGVPDPNASIPDEFERAKWKDGFGLALLLYPDLDGRERCLGETAFAGKAMILQLLGSWCPNCHDETAYLARLHERYKHRGLSVVGLAFELTPDFERSAAQVRRMSERHGVQYPMLIAGSSDKAKAAEAFPAIDRVLAFPTTIFLHRDGRVRAIHSGFAGPGTKGEHAQLTKQFESIVEELLAEPDSDEREMWDYLESGTWRDSRGGPELQFRRNETDPATRADVRGSTVVFGDTVWHVDRRNECWIDPRSYGRRLFRSGAGDRAGRCSLAGAPRHELWFAVEHRDRSVYPDVGPIVPLLSDDDLVVRTTAAWAAGKLAFDDLGRSIRTAGPALIPCTRHGFASLRREAARAIGMIGYQEGVPALRDLLSDPDPLVREAAQQSLSRLAPR